MPEEVSLTIVVLCFLVVGVVSILRSKPAGHAAPVKRTPANKASNA